MRRYAILNVISWYETDVCVSFAHDLKKTLSDFFPKYLALFQAKYSGMSVTAMSMHKKSTCIQGIDVVYLAVGMYS